MQLKFKIVFVVVNISYGLMNFMCKLMKIGVYFQYMTDKDCCFSLFYKMNLTL